MDTGHLITLQSLVAFGVVWLIERMKSSSLRMFRVVNVANPLLLRTISSIGAFLIGAGFTYEWHGAAEDGFQLIIGIPALAKFADTLLAFGWQMLNQEVQYKALFKGNPTI